MIKAQAVIAPAVPLLFFPQPVWMGILTKHVKQQGLW